MFTQEKEGVKEEVIAVVAARHQKSPKKSPVILKRDLHSGMRSRIKSGGRQMRRGGEADQDVAIPFSSFPVMTQATRTAAAHLAYQHMHDPSANAKEHTLWRRGGGGGGVPGHRSGS